jgi:LmbE family N-acetylglucosaminyl deacetylase
MDILAQEYGPDASPSRRLLTIQEAIDSAVAATEVRSVFVPLGVTHPDHVTVSDVALQAVVTSNRESFVYMDMPYGQARPGEVRRRLRRIARKFQIDSLVPFLGDLQSKSEAVNAYSSQMEALRHGFGKNFDRIFVDPERYWRVRPPT